MTLPVENATGTAMRPIAVVDVGSNSICLLVLQPLADGGWTVVDKLKDTARLRADIGADGALSAAGLERAVAALVRFRAAADAAGAEVCAVATAALRAATNADEFLGRARVEAGIAVEVISGHEEARLAYLGVLQGMAPVAADVLCADVGGGSTELLLGEGRRALRTASIPIGALVVTRTWIGADPVLPTAIDRARDGLLAAFLPELEGFRGAIAARSGPLVGIATSGTIQRVARIARALGSTTAPIPDGDADVQGLILTRDDMQGVVAALVAAPTNEARQRIPGMDASRADILLGGALIHEVVADGLGLSNWTVSMAGLRMGIAADVRIRRGLG